jgi:hypothetical protein
MVAHVLKRPHLLGIAKRIALVLLVHAVPTAITYL